MAASPSAHLVGSRSKQKGGPRMGPQFSIRRPSRLHGAAGALLLIAPGTAVALSTSAADAQGTAAPSHLSVALHQHPSPFGRLIVVTGTAPAADAGDSVALEY